MAQCVHLTPHLSVVRITTEAVLSTLPGVCASVGRFCHINSDTTTRAAVKKARRWNQNVARRQSGGEVWRGC